MPLTNLLSMYYNLLGKPIDVMEWAHLFEDQTYRRLALDEYHNHTISTVWLGIDHSFGAGAPLIFETMIFGDSELDQEQRRYSNFELAMEGHALMVELVKDHYLLNLDRSSDLC